MRRLLLFLLGCAIALELALAGPVQASPGLCVGPVCGEEITRSLRHPWQLSLRMSDQRGRRERLLVDCRSGSLSPLAGPVERGYAAAVARRACRLAE